MPVCDRCHARKDEKAFAARKQAPGRRHPTCKACASELAKLGYRFCSYCLRWMWSDNFHGKQKIRCIDCYTARRYGMTIEEYEWFCLSNGKSCGICGVETKLVVDHDHETGRPRGRLCHSCNVALGHLKDSPELIDKAGEYLRNFNKRYTLEASLDDVFWPGDEVN